MPRDITVTFEDGTNHVYKGAPDNITPDAVQARAQKEFNKPIVNLDGGVPTIRQNVGAEPQRRNYAISEVPMAAVTNIPKSTAEAVMGVYQAVTSPEETLKTISQAIGGGFYNALPKQAQKFVVDITQNPEGLKKAIDTANAIGGIYTDRYGDWEKIKRTMAEDPVGAMGDISMLFSGGAMGASKAGMAKTAGALTTAASATNPINVVAKPVEMYAKSKNALLQSQKEANATRDANVLAAQREGFVVTPGSLTPTGANVIKERIAGKTYLEQLASINNQQMADKVARRAVGLAENSALTPEAMKSIRKAEYAKGYEPVKNLGNIVADTVFLDDLTNIQSSYTGASKSFPLAVPDEVGNLIKKYNVEKFDAADAVDVIKKLREQASGNFRKGENDLAKSQLDISTALEGQIARTLEASGDPKLANLLEQFKTSRQRMAISHTIEDAIRVGSGSVDAKKLGRDIQNDKFMTGDLKTIAEFANTFPRVNVPPSTIGTPGANAVLNRSLSSAAGGGLGYLASGGNPLVSMAAMAAPELVSAGMRQYMLSKMGQQNILPKYDKYKNLSKGLSDEGVRNALLSIQAAELARENKNALAR
jgi:hypothetical protein